MRTFIAVLTCCLFAAGCYQNAEKKEAGADQGPISDSYDYVYGITRVNVDDIASKVFLVPGLFRFSLDQSVWYPTYDARRLSFTPQAAAMAYHRKHKAVIRFSLWPNKGTSPKKIVAGLVRRSRAAGDQCRIMLSSPGQLEVAHCTSDSGSDDLVFLSRPLTGSRGKLLIIIGQWPKAHGHELLNQLLRMNSSLRADRSR